ncbi:hypothetical protein [Pelotomaculum propionicicum]|uniref:Uncharacterized protein n=1 Tax=Pelotomaculum propionicicum TaxID=258475 RepID=A0A4Y7RC68_9FIRM|nr:hypothetical protein [Pelotomaculum propionicicum]TEB06313.1 hypothetical protein Pmgp_03784 [Pelotomaculum propionicicum]
MHRKTCTRCGKDSYSAAVGSEWSCPHCGGDLTGEPGSTRGTVLLAGERTLPSQGDGSLGWRFSPAKNRGRDTRYRVPHAQIRTGVNQGDGSSGW